LYYILELLLSINTCQGQDIYIKKYYMDLSKQKTWQWKWINKNMSLIELKGWYKLNFGNEIHKSQLVLPKLKGDAFKTSTYIISFLKR
jgi:hypothetical protein